MSTTLVPVDERTAEAIREMLPEEFQKSLNKALISQAFLVTRDKTGTIHFYVNRTGLLVFMEKKFRSKKAHYSIKTELLSEEEERRLRKSLHITEEEPFIAMRGIVEIEYEDGKKETFQDIGTASPKDCFHSRLVEMAATRATNRAMRLVTSLGFTSVEELPASEAHETHRNNEKPAPEPETYNGRRVVEGETLDDLPFEELPQMLQIKILTETDSIFKKIAEQESIVRGVDVKVDEVKKRFLEDFRASSRKELTYAQLRKLWKKAKKYLEELEEEIPEKV